MSGFLQCCTLLENFTDDAIGKLYVTKFLTFSLYLTKLNVTERFAIASSVTYSEIRQNFSNSVRVCRVFLAPIVYTLQALPPKESLGFECGDAQFFWDSVSTITMST